MEFKLLKYENLLECQIRWIVRTFMISSMGKSSWVSEVWKVESIAGKECGVFLFNLDVFFVQLYHKMTKY